VVVKAQRNSRTCAERCTTRPEREPGVNLSPTRAPVSLSMALIAPQARQFAAQSAPRLARPTSLYRRVIGLSGRPIGGTHR
jgi:hypothetical protein